MTQHRHDNISCFCTILLIIHIHRVANMTHWIVHLGALSFSTQIQCFGKVESSSSEDPCIFLVPALLQHASIHLAASVLYYRRKIWSSAFSKLLPGKYSDAFATTHYMTLPRRVTGTLGGRGHHSVVCCLFEHTPPPPLIASGRNTQQSAVTNVAPYCKVPHDTRCTSDKAHTSSESFDGMYSRSFCEVWCHCTCM